MNYFWTTIQIVNPQPLNLIEIILLNLTVTQEGSQAVKVKRIDIYIVAINSSLYLTNTTSNTKIVQNSCPAFVQTFCVSTWTYCSTNVDAVNPVRSSSQHKLNSTVVPATFVKSFSFNPLSFAL